MNQNKFAGLFEEIPGTESLVFLLTKLRNGDVRAELIHDVNDHRLNSKDPFAAICIEHFRLDQPLLDYLSELTGSVVDSYVSGVGMCHILRPRMYNGMLAGTRNDFFDALANANGDVILSVYDEEEDEWRWHVKA